MNKQTMASTASGVISGAGVINSTWLWFLADPAAHTLSILTALLVISQLFWGWRKFLKGGV
ncbi:hypothetical protein [Paraburkholderia pallida]|uniref:Holin n=1 Tax=Paraburkholderia pallida TaxID=2547399 RepID=A0A4V1AZH2_9BURK|nr:hypothetical protein [Paraburkholderia pallida]QBQ99262.1 hypothetical protein E1956_18835 [Paraburkholderia pallida]